MLHVDIIHIRLKNLSIECLCVLDFALGRKFFAVIYGNATAILSNKSIVCRVWRGGGCSEHQRGTAESLDERAAAKGSSRTEPRCFYTPVAVNTSTLTRAILKVQKLYVRPSFEYSTSGRTSVRPRALTRAYKPPFARHSRAYVRCTHAHLEDLCCLSSPIYERRGRLRAYGKSFTRASISSRASSDALS